jgi:acetate CoA/acetoacetate CoA-transferase beta subunit
MDRPQGLTRELMTMRVAQELRDGMAVNLGIGLPTLTASFVPEGRTVFFQAENGILGYGGVISGSGDYDQDRSAASRCPSAATSRTGWCRSAAAAASAGRWTSRPARSGSSS